ncbi:MAG: hypothetical protein DWQ10_03500 [Calditrichaeota bacterium]|nr:MAG: hypothetical protein DWQ10_03500 [Calditrichota bacterium]
MNTRKALFRSLFFPLYLVAILVSFIRFESDAYAFSDYDATVSRVLTEQVFVQHPVKYSVKNFSSQKDTSFSTPVPQTECARAVRLFNACLCAQLKQYLLKTYNFLPQTYFLRHQMSPPAAVDIDASLPG